MKRIDAREPKFQRIHARLPGVHHDANLDRVSGDLVLNLNYCGQDPAAIQRAAEFLARLSQLLRLSQLVRAVQNTHSS